MIKYIFPFFVYLFCYLDAQDNFHIVELLNKGTDYYNQGDYSNAIIIFEDLLAEQERIYENDNIQAAETMIRLGELYSYMDMSDISAYYFQQAVMIFEKSFQSAKEGLEISLLKLLQIYSFNKDTIMEKNIQNRLYSISSFLQNSEENQHNIATAEHRLYSQEEDNAIDLM